jgi:hypothetical protein
VWGLLGGAQGAAHEAAWTEGGPGVSPDVAGIPWHMWVPDYKQPTTCQIEGCMKPVQRVFYWRQIIAVPPEELRPLVMVFACVEHADDLERLIEKLRIG